MKKKGWIAAFRRKQYVIAGALIVIAAIGTTVYYSSTQEKERGQLESQLAEEMEQAVGTEEIAGADVGTELEAAQIEIERLKHQLYLAEMENRLLKKLDEIERMDASDK